MEEPGGAAAAAPCWPACAAAYHWLYSCKYLGNVSNIASTYARTYVRIGLTQHILRRQHKDPRPQRRSTVRIEQRSRRHRGHR